MYFLHRLMARVVPVDVNNELSVAHEQMRNEQMKNEKTSFETVTYI